MDKRQKILIVDDSKLNRDILKEILGETYQEVTHSAVAVYGLIIARNGPKGN